MVHFLYRESLSNERNNMSDDFMPILEGKFIGVSLDNPNKIVTTENIQHLDPHYLIYSYAMKNFVEVNPDQTLSKIEPTKIGGQDYPDKLILSLLKLHDLQNKNDKDAQTYGYHLAQVPTVHLYALQLQAKIEGNTFEKAYPDPKDENKIYIFNKDSTPNDKGVYEWVEATREQGNTFLVNFGDDRIKRYDFNPNTFGVSYQGIAADLNEPVQKQKRLVKGSKENGNSI